MLVAVGSVLGLESRMVRLVMPAARRSFAVAKPMPVAAPFGGC